MTTSRTGSTGSSWEPPSVEQLRELLPQYHISDFIGRGGMGAVYKGRQASLQRDVAIKLLPELLTFDDGLAGFVDRFKVEARAMANLDHPSIVSVYDFGEVKNSGAPWDESQAGPPDSAGGEVAFRHLYFVMEFIDGMNLQEHLRRNGGTLEVASAIDIVSSVLDALDHAHRHGVIHRDIKPANVLINSEGRVKIADFGLAKNLGTGDTSCLTLTNMALGSPGFMAPEALMGAPSLDGRADLYAVGVMLYRMITGGLPQGMFKLPGERDPAIDPRLDELIAEALEPDPEHRIADAAEFRRRLNEIQSRPAAQPASPPPVAAATEPPTEPAFTAREPPPRRKKSAAPVAWTVFLLFVLIAALAAALFRQPSSDTAAPPPPDHPRFAARIAEYQQARYDRVVELTTKHGTALKEARRKAVASGDAAATVAIDAASTSAKSLAPLIVTNRSSGTVTPFPELARLGAGAPGDVLRLHTGFERELRQIEAELAAGLAQSLTTLETSLVQAGDLETSRTLQAWRKHLSTLFPPAGQQPAAPLR